MTHFLVYWKPDTVVADQGSPRLLHSASSQYNRVSRGDILWVVTSEGPGDLLLVGRQKVDRLVGQLEAEQMANSSNLWEADYHAFSNEPEEKENLDISRWARRLYFEGVVDRLPEDFTGQHLQTMRRLDDGSGNLMERLWAQRNHK